MKYLGRLQRHFLWFCILPILMVGSFMAPAESSVAATTGNVVCVSTNTRSTDKGAWIRVYGSGGLGWADVPRGRCSTDYGIKSVDQFYVRSGYVAVSQWGYNYQGGGLYNLILSNNRVTLTVIYTGFSGI